MQRMTGQSLPIDIFAVRRESDAVGCEHGPAPVRSAQFFAVGLNDHAFFRLRCRVAIKHAVGASAREIDHHEGSLA